MIDRSDDDRIKKTLLPLEASMVESILNRRLGRSPIALYLHGSAVGFAALFAIFVAVTLYGRQGVI